MKDFENVDAKGYINSAVYAMQDLQKEMTGEAERTGLTSEEKIDKLVADTRYETEDIC